MTSDKNQIHLNIEQHEMFETAQKRIKQKRRLWQHFVIFVLGCVFMYVLNKFLGYGENATNSRNWYIYGIIVWTFLFLLHLINVFITNRFLGKEWERNQREKLVSIQKRKIQKIQDEVEKLYVEQTSNLSQEQSN